MVRAAIDETRRPWWRREQPLSHALPEPALSDSTASVDDRLQLRAALLDLPVKQRAVLVLRFLEGLSVQPTADIVGSPEGTVKVYTSRGLAALRKVLGVDLAEDSEEANRSHRLHPELRGRPAHRHRGGPGLARLRSTAPRTPTVGFKLTTVPAGVTLDSGGRANDATGRSALPHGSYLRLLKGEVSYRNLPDVLAVEVRVYPREYGPEVPSGVQPARSGYCLGDRALVEGATFAVLDNPGTWYPLTSAAG